MLVLCYSIHVLNHLHYLNQLRLFKQFTKFVILKYNWKYSYRNSMNNSLVRPITLLSSIRMWKFQKFRTIIIIHLDAFTLYRNVCFEIYKFSSARKSLENLTEGERKREPWSIFQIANAIETLKNENINIQS